MIKRFKEAMKYNNLLIEFKVLVKVNASTAATEFIAMFTALLNDYLALVDNVSNEVAKIHNTLVSDKLTRLNNIDKYHNGYCPDRAIQLEMVNLMKPIIAARRIAKVDASKTIDKPYWQYTKDDLMTINDPARLEAIYNVYSSYISKPRSLEIALAHFFKSSLDGDNAEAIEFRTELRRMSTIKQLAELRTFANARKNELQKVKISAALQAKLDKGSKAVLSAADIAELQAFLKASNK